MHLLYRTTIDDMVAVFLKAEIASAGFGEKVRAQLAMDGKERSIVDSPEKSCPEKSSAPTSTTTLPPRNGFDHALIYPPATRHLTTGCAKKGLVFMAIFRYNSCTLRSFQR